MAGQTDPITVDEIIAALREGGYQLSRRTFQYYVQAGLLPKGNRVGSESGGVRFYYPGAVVNRLRLLFTLKAKGLKLNEIKEHLRDTNGLAGCDCEPRARTDNGQARAAALAGGERADLYELVMHLTPGGEALRLCLQCGTCSGSCPAAADMDHTPGRLLSLLASGQGREVLASNTPWLCISCYSCTVRCPQRIPITEIMFTIKELAMRAGVARMADDCVFCRMYVSLLEKYGRSFDLGLAFRYQVQHGSKDGPSLALQLHKQRPRLIHGPSRIEQINQLRQIMARAKGLCP